MEEEVKDIWHVYSDGTRADIPFDTTEDKVYTWNSVAISAETAGVKVLVLTINDTHLHCLTKGDTERVAHFKKVLRQRLANRFARIHFACSPVRTRKEAKAKFMYVYRNCLDFYKKLPGEYPWGSGNIYFSEHNSNPADHRIGDYSLREQYRMFRTRMKLPEGWMVDTYGRILSDSFIDYVSVEQLFVSVRSFIAFLYVRWEDEVALKQEIHRNYRLYPSNFIALDMLEGSNAHEDRYTKEDKAFFDKYLQGQLAKIDLEKPDHQFLRERMLTMYANPARNQLILSAK